MFKENVKRFNNLLAPFMSQLENMYENDSVKTCDIVESRTGDPTLQITVAGRELFVHSKYNPIQEAERLAKRLDDLSESDHIIFYGVGLGYHIEYIMRQYPTKKFTVIEPNIEVFVRFLQSRSLHNFPFSQLFTVHIECGTMSMYQFLAALSTELRSGGFVYVLPAYERIFKDELTQFYAAYQDALKTTKSNIAARISFSKRWVVNSLMNVRKTVRTKNIIEKAEHFKNKPIIIAAAGPSLQEDIKQLKQIKENGSAYIFAVGSANKAFIAHDITPDAVLTYDPQPHNVGVFRELMTSGRTDIPMIYGTSVGFETTETYPGQLFHFVNSADTVSNYYTGRMLGEFDVHDSTTIALVAIQVAEQLGAGQIILTGQNLAFKQERFYAKGIKHGDWEGEVREEREGQNVVTIKDVYGNDIESNESLVNMRRDIETYIESRPHLNVINTTKGGADIKGARFMPIEEVIKTKLQDRAVTEDWYKVEEKAIAQRTINQVKKMERSIERMYDLLDSCYIDLEKIYELKQTDKAGQISRLFKSFDRSFNRLIKTDFYTCFIAPILKIELEELKKVVAKTREEQNLEKRLNAINAIYTTFLAYVQEIFYEMTVHVKEAVHPSLLSKTTDVQLYRHNDGVFHYEEDWERETVSFNDLSRGETVRKLSRSISTKSKEKGATISFRFEGTYLQLLAQTHDTYADAIKVTIDGDKKTIQTKNRGQSDKLSPKLNEQIFEIHALQNGMHDVEIELLSDEPFHFQGIAINEDGRVYHVDEVTTVEELEVGKRIRCHIGEVDEEGVAKIKSLGQVKVNQMPLDSYDRSKDFYIEKVIEENDGRSYFMSNRNLGVLKAIHTESKDEFIFNKIPVLHTHKTDYVMLDSSAYYETKNNKWNAVKTFNKQLQGVDNAWASDRGQLMGWIKIQFQKPTRISCYSLTSQDKNPFFDSAKRMPKSWTLEGWDGLNWEILDVCNNITTWSTREKKVFKLNNEKKYISYRIDIKENNGDAEFIAIGEVEIV